MPNLKKKLLPRLGKCRSVARLGRCFRKKTAADYPSVFDLAMMTKAGQLDYLAPLGRAFLNQKRQTNESRYACQLRQAKRIEMRGL